MTQFSLPWACDEVGDGGAASYTLDVVESSTRILSNLSPTTSGVVYWTSAEVLPYDSFVNASTGLLAPTNPSGNTIRIASGVGVVKGWIYANDDNVDFDATGAASATDIIVLRMDRSAQTVRLAHVQAGAGGTATVTQNSTTYEVLIATIGLDGSGNISTLTDNREFARPPVGSVSLIETKESDGTDLSFNFTNLPPLFRDFILTGSTRVDFTAADFDYNYIYIRANGIGTASYYSVREETDGAGKTDTVTAGDTGINIGPVECNNGTTGFFTSFEIRFVNANLSSGMKTCFFKTFSNRDTTTGTDGVIMVSGAGSLYDNSALSSIAIISPIGGPPPPFISGSRVYIFGVV